MVTLLRLDGLMAGVEGVSFLVLAALYWRAYWGMKKSSIICSLSVLFTALFIKGMLISAAMITGFGYLTYISFGFRVVTLSSVVYFLFASTTIPKRVSNAHELNKKILIGGMHGKVTQKTKTSSGN